MINYASQINFYALKTLPAIKVGIFINSTKCEYTETGAVTQRINNS